MVENWSGDVNVLPGEAFVAAGSFAEKLLDKVSNAIGWSVIPKNTAKYRREAEEYLIEKIKSDENIPPLLKAAYMSNARKIIKKYSNQCDVFNGAMNYLATEDSLKNIEKVDNDWLEFFFNKVEDIGREDMKVIWSKLLAGEIINPNSVSKQLLHILSVIDYADAQSFVKLMKFIINIGEDIYVTIFNSINGEFYKKKGLLDDDIIRLENIGLLQYDVSGYGAELDEGEKVFYFGKSIDIGERKFIPVGKVMLTKAGRELMAIIIEDNRDDEYEKYLPQLLTQGI